MIRKLGKRTLVLCFFYILFIPWIHSSTTDPKCGRPGRAPDSFVIHSKISYGEGDTVTYSCGNGTLLSRSFVRRCLPNGSWAGPIPKCYKQIPIKGARLVPLSSESSNAALSIDGKFDPCSITEKTNESFWEGNVDPAAEIKALKITFPRNEPVNIQVIIKGNETETICDSYSGTVGIPEKQRSVVIFCPKAAAGNLIHIRDLNQGLHNFRICEVAAYLPSVPHCLVPDYPLHGSGFKSSSSQDSKFLFQCDVGYELWGSKEAVCLSDGTWSERTPICTLIICDIPSPPLNGSILPHPYAKEVRAGQSISYICDSGFILKGNRTVTCIRFRTWSSSPPICVPTVSRKAPKGCRSPPVVANGKLSVNSILSGSIAFLTCDEGYTPLTSDKMHCLDTGDWSPLYLACKAIQCEENPIIPHGRAKLVDLSAYYGSHLQIICNQGHMKEYPINRTCESSGTWGDLSVCIELSCGTPSFLTPFEGRWVSWNHSIPIRVLECDPGYYIEGSPAVTQCLSNGSWSYTSAVCKRRHAERSYSNVSSPNLFLIIAVAVMSSSLCCCSLCFVVWKKRKQSKTSTTVFHDAIDDSSVYTPGIKENSLIQNNFYNKPTYDDIIEMRPKSMATKPRTALPHLPIDADPVYAQPFETAPIPNTKQIVFTNKDDLYNAHIYAEPIDSRTQSSGNNHVPNCMAETWFRTGTGKFGRKLSLPVNSPISNDSLQEEEEQNELYNTSCHYQTVSTSDKTMNEICQNFDLETKNGNSFRPLIDNSIYLETKNLPSHINLVRMISNDIYQDEQFSNV